MGPTELHYVAYGCIIYVKKSIHLVVVIDKNFKITIASSSYTQMILLLVLYAFYQSEKLNVQTLSYIRHKTYATRKTTLHKKGPLRMT
jgi:hypothetical protein